MRSPWRYPVDTIGAWVDDGGPQWSAAIAYYAVLSLAPMLILVSTMAGLAFEGVPAFAMRDQISLVLGRRGADFAMTLIEGTQLPDSGFPGLAGNVVILMVGATIVFANVQGALNRIWGLRWVKGGVVRGVIRQRLLAFAMIVVTGLIMLVSVGLSTVAGIMSEQIGDVLGAPIVVSAVDVGISVVVLAVLFAATFRILPDGDIAWRDAALGASVTAVLFVVGKILVSLYLTRASLVTAYGVAGSLVFFLVWVYYSAAIFFIGAEFTELWARDHGRPIRPDDGAARVERNVLQGEDG